jgi:hypothetical protein
MTEKCFIKKAMSTQIPMKKEVRKKLLAYLMVAVMVVVVVTVAASALI